MNCIDSVEGIRERLAAFPAHRLKESTSLSHAAVALLVREGRGPGAGSELLMIRRAEHPNDPWSGQMGFPGGRVDPTDLAPREAAERETLEELGILLSSQASFLGTLSEIRARSRAKILPMSIFPFVYELTGTAPFQLNHEVAEAVWIPLRFFFDPSNRSRMEPLPDETVGALPCYRYAGCTIWGLSLKMIDEFLFEVLPYADVYGRF